MKFVLYDKKTGSTLDEDYVQNIFIGLDGKVYEVYSACFDGVSWLETEDVSYKFGAYLIGVDVEL